jgi:hypothetical protein
VRFHDSHIGGSARRAGRSSWIGPAGLGEGEPTVGTRLEGTDLDDRISVERTIDMREEVLPALHSVVADLRPHAFGIDAEQDEILGSLVDDVGDRPNLAGLAAMDEPDLVESAVSRGYAVLTGPARMVPIRCECHVVDQAHRFRLRGEKPKRPATPRGTPVAAAG